MNRKVLAIAILMFLFSCMNIQAGKYDSSYNYQRGMEAFNKNDFAEAYKYFIAELEANPKNPLACYRMAIIYGNSDQWGMALTAINHAIEYDDHSDKEQTSNFYYISAKINAKLGDNDKAIEAFNEAIKYAPIKDGFIQELASFHYDIGQYDQCATNLEKLLSSHPDDAYLYNCLGTCYTASNQYDKALQNLNKSISLDSTYSLPYSCRGNIYYNQGKYQAAVENLIKSIELDTTGNVDNEAGNICAVADSAYEMTVDMLKAQIEKDPKKSIFVVTLGTCYYNHGKMRDAAKSYEKAYKIDSNDRYAFWAANCYIETCNFKKALKLFNTINDPSFENNILVGKSQISLFTGQEDSALYYIDKAIAAEPENIQGYVYRAFIYRSIKDYKKACDDEEMAISFNPDDMSNYMVHGRTLTSLGREEEAKALWEKEIKLDTLETNENTIYAHCLLGHYDKAEAMCKKMLEKKPQFGSYYDASDIYCLMGKKEQALTCLGKTLELGYRNFYIMEKSPYHDAIKDMPQYKALIKKYKAILQQEIAEDGE